MWELEGPQGAKWGGDKSISPLAVHVKESSVEVWMGSKGGMLKALIGLRKIAESRCSSIIEDPQCPNHSYSLSLRRLATSRLVYDEGIGRKLLTFPLCCFDQISCWFPRNTP